MSSQTNARQIHYPILISDMTLTEISGVLRDLKADQVIGEYLNRVIGGVHCEPMEMGKFFERLMNILAFKKLQRRFKTEDRHTTVFGNTLFVNYLNQGEK